MQITETNESDKVDNKKPVHDTGVLMDFSNSFKSTTRAFKGQKGKPQPKPQ